MSEQTLHCGGAIFDGGSFIFGERDLGEHALHIAACLQQLRSTRAFRHIEIAGARRPCSAGNARRMCTCSTHAQHRSIAIVRPPLVHLAATRHGDTVQGGPTTSAIWSLNKLRRTTNQQPRPDSVEQCTGPSAATVWEVALPPDLSQDQPGAAGGGQVAVQLARVSARYNSSPAAAIGVLRRVRLRPRGRAWAAGR